MGNLFGAQAVMGHYADGMVVAAEVAERLELPLVCVPHSLGVLEMTRLGMDPTDQQELRDPQFHFWTRETFELAALRAANFETANTPEEPRALEGHYGIRFPYEVMPAGASRAFFDAGESESNREAIERLGLEVGKFLVFWGRLSKAKYVEGVVKVLGEERRKHPYGTAGLRVLIVGGSPQSPSEEERAVRAAICEQMDHYGLTEADVIQAESMNHPTLAPIARGALAYVGTQRLEPFGMSAAEAMGVGLPVLLSQRAGITSGLKDRTHQVDLTYSLLLENATCKIFLAPSSLDRIDEVRKRNHARDPEQDFDFVHRVLLLEHDHIAPLEQRADLVVDKEYHLRP